MTAQLPFPIGVVVPTLNARDLLPAHLAQMKTWLDLTEELIVVDSFSTDGTFELLQAELHHPRLKILQRPRGLYQSWNYGVTQVSAKYTYISTVGDTITRAGLEHLLTTADAIGSDVVISRPEFFDPNGHRIENRSWPIHQLLKSEHIKEPFRLESWHAFAAAILDIPEGILGSSAGNLYRTDTLKRFPFPEDYGHAGDTAWGILHALSTCIAVTPQVLSRFVVHPNANVPAGEEMWRLVDRLLDLAAETLTKNLSEPSLETLSAELALLVKRLPAELKALHQSQRHYDLARRAVRPWFVNPNAWKTRAERNRQRAAVRQTRARIRKHICANGLKKEPVVR